MAPTHWYQILLSSHRSGQILQELAGFCGERGEKSGVGDALRSENDPEKTFPAYSWCSDLGMAVSEATGYGVSLLTIMWYGLFYDLLAEVMSRGPIVPISASGAERYTATASPR
jgi:hypothetical protein